MGDLSIVNEQPKEKTTETQILRAVKGASNGVYIVLSDRYLYEYAKIHAADTTEESKEK